MPHTKAHERFRVCLAQIEVIAGDPQANLRSMLHVIQDEAANADLIAFAEMAVPGYLVGDLWLDEAWCDWMMSFNATLQAASADHGIAVLYGNVFLPKDGSANKDGRRRKFNAAYLYQRGKPARRAKTGLRGIPDGVQPKTLLPNYRFFDDERYFFSFADQATDEGMPLASACQPFLLDWKENRPLRLGLQVCEDLWCADYRINGRALNTARMLKANGAEAIVNISSSPWTYGKNAARDRRIAFLEEDGAQVPFLYVNRVGAENCGDNVIVYDGGTTAYGEDGAIRKMASTGYQADRLTCELCDRGGCVTLDAGPALGRQDHDKIARKREAIRQGLLHMRQMTGLQEPRFVIGLSGGVDSAVVAALLVDAFGKDSLIALTMPSRHTSAETLANARHVAAALGVPLKSIAIDEAVDAARRELDAAAGPAAPGSLAHENEQARVRGSIYLAGLAARLGRLFTNNGNKLETALGYATLYGDVNGAIAPIADLTKVEVVALARHLNEQVFHREVIPANLLPSDLWIFPKRGVQPTAELRDKQVDPMRFGYHDALLEAMTDFKRANLEAIAGWYLEGQLHERLGIPIELLKRWNLDQPKTFIDDLEWFAGQIRRNVFKRVQAPPIIITSKSAYGYDIRESIGADRPTEGYLEVREKVLNLSEYKPKTGQQ